MRKEEIKYFCDVCKKEIDKEDCLTVIYPVVCTTDQTNKFVLISYIEQRKLDICKYCGGKVLKIIVSASASQRFGDYKIITEENPMAGVEDEN